MHLLMNSESPSDTTYNAEIAEHAEIIGLFSRVFQRVPRVLR